LRAVASGRVEHWEERTTRAMHLTREGARAEHDVTEAVLVRDVVDSIDRLKAQRALPAAEVALLETETQLIQARPVGSTIEHRHKQGEEGRLHTARRQDLAARSRNASWVIMLPT
jgi:hypothetical protein